MTINIGLTIKLLFLQIIPSFLAFIIYFSNTLNQVFLRSLSCCLEHVKEVMTLTIKTILSSNIFYEVFQRIFPVKLLYRYSVLLEFWQYCVGLTKFSCWSCYSLLELMKTLFLWYFCMPFSTIDHLCYSYKVIKEQNLCIFIESRQTNWHKPDI